MLVRQRYDMILELLKQNGIVHTSDLVERMGVSSETVRKDLKQLEERGMLSRVHGGAIPVEEEDVSKFPPGYVSLRMRNSQYMEEKNAIVQYAVSQVEEQQVVALDYGSTSQLMALALKEHFRQLTVITNSLHNALLLADCPGFTIIMPGGVMNKNEYTLVDTFPPMLENLHIDIYFMTVSGIHPTIGCTDLGFREVSIQNWMRQAADCTVVVTDSSKFGHASLIRVCGVEEVDMIVTDRKISREMESQFAQVTDKLVIV